MHVRYSWILGFILFAFPATAEDPPLPKNQKDKVSYGMGVQAAKSLKQQGIDVDPDLMMKGLKDELSGGKLLISEDEIGKSLRMYKAGLRQKRVEDKKLAAAENKKKGEAFLADNAGKEGVVTLPGGLQYRILKAGDGKVPAAADKVEVHYRGTHIDGSEFDSSNKTGKPATFLVKGGIIRGWTEALTRMPVGSKWQLFVPHNLAYGTRGAGTAIGPNETLVFELELLAIK